ncbi:hypothetical protein D3C73_948030 [compost metagenome]
MVIGFREAGLAVFEVFGVGIHDICNLIGYRFQLIERIAKNIHSQRIAAQTTAGHAGHITPYTVRNLSGQIFDQLFFDGIEIRRIAVVGDIEEAGVVRAHTHEAAAPDRVLQVHHMVLLHNKGFRLQPLSLYILGSLAGFWREGHNYAFVFLGRHEAHADGFDQE